MQHTGDQGEIYANVWL